MLDYERGLYVVIEQLAKGPAPFPLEHGFGLGAAYRVLGIYNPSESGECWLILSNDDNQLWYISQRHVRTHSLVPSSSVLRMVFAPITASEDFRSCAEEGTVARIADHRQNEVDACRSRAWQS